MPVEASGHLDRAPDGAVDDALARALAAGEAVAEAVAESGPAAGRRLLVWSAGEAFGDLGWPRLNQRVALFAEQLLDGTAERARKSFALPEGEVEVAVRVHRPARRS
ncbi:MAG: hypothetical protein KJ058_09095 [Thermoanaerobaculia bacterium]|nr:hypothetical protein [Thermoanaerobaculia bacterium]MCZ7649947.1 hypothetical protein [Thermoanaerobaculia bacterium]